MRHCLVIERDRLLKNDNTPGVLPAFQGLMHLDGDAMNKLGNLMHDHAFYMEREYAETNPDYKQIIPVVVFRHNDEYLFYKRRSDHTEQRLADKWTCLIGGHIDPEDSLDDGEPMPRDWGILMAGWAREAEEEAGVSEDRMSMAIEMQHDLLPYYLINDDSDEVGKVHIGVVFVVNIAKSHLAFGEEIAETKWAKLNEVGNNPLEGWAQIVVDGLLK